MKIQQYITTAIAALFLVFVAIYGYRTKSDDKGEDKVIVQEQSIKRITDTLTEKPIRVQWKWSKELLIVAPSSGSIHQVMVKNRQFVKKGEVMFQLLRDVSKVNLDAASKRVAELEQDILELEKKQDTDKTLTDAQQVNLNSRLGVLRHALVLAKQVMNDPESKTSTQIVNVYAPIDGLVDHLSVAFGGEVGAKQLLSYLIPYQAEVFPTAEQAKYIGRPDSNHVQRSFLFNYNNQNYVLGELQKEKEDGYIAQGIGLKGAYNDTLTLQAMFVSRYKNSVAIPQTSVEVVGDQLYLWTVDSQGEYKKNEVMALGQADDTYYFGDILDVETFVLNPIAIKKEEAK
ncbi:hypothetical protein VSO92_05015 [Myroides pelagicus]|uniref:hypothetical protein n=1 Tax=Myroides pelagicus TaxID=270914 RepID=UPI002DBDC2B2|nr:hypothetical protein [Myroides pelagicus]MEC4113467.1 hypothetical protein [Myroides pelagicus]